MKDNVETWKRDREFLKAEIINDEHFLMKRKTTDRKTREEKTLCEKSQSILVKLRVACSHIGIDSVDQFDWSHAPNLWPNLEVLQFLNESDSSLNVLKSIAPHLSEFQHLKNLTISPNITNITHCQVLSPLDFLAQTGHPLPIGLCVRTEMFCIEGSCLCHRQE